MLATMSHSFSFGYCAAISGDDATNTLSFTGGPCWRRRSAARPSVRQANSRIRKSLKAGDGSRARRPPWPVTSRRVPLIAAIVQERTFPGCRARS